MSNKEFPISKGGLPHLHLAVSHPHLVIGHSVLVIGNSLLLRRIRIRPENDQCPTRNFQFPREAFLISTWPFPAPLGHWTFRVGYWKFSSPAESGSDRRMTNVQQGISNVQGRHSRPHLAFFPAPLGHWTFRVGYWKFSSPAESGSDRRMTNVQQGISNFQGRHSRPHLAVSHPHLVIGHSVLVIGNSLLLRRIRISPANDHPPLGERPASRRSGSRSAQFVVASPGLSD